MNHRTQLYLDDDQYSYLKNLARLEGRSIAQIIRDWIQEHRSQKLEKRHQKDSFWKLRGIGSSGLSTISKNFDTYLYGGQKK